MKQGLVKISRTSRRGDEERINIAIIVENTSHINVSLSLTDFANTLTGGSFEECSVDRWQIDREPPRKSEDEENWTHPNTCQCKLCEDGTFNLGAKVPGLEE